MNTTVITIFALHNLITVFKFVIRGQTFGTKRYTRAGTVPTAVPDTASCADIIIDIPMPCFVFPLDITKLQRGVYLEPSISIRNSIESNRNSIGVFVGEMVSAKYMDMLYNSAIITILGSNFV